MVALQLFLNMDGIIYLSVSGREANGFGKAGENFTVVLVDAF